MSETYVHGRVQLTVILPYFLPSCCEMLPNRYIHVCLLLTGGMIAKENGVLQTVLDAVQESAGHLHNPVKKVTGLQGAAGEVCAGQQHQYPQQPPS